MINLRIHRIKHGKLTVGDTLTFEQIFQCFLVQETQMLSILKSSEVPKRN